jgi:hypothetical protein
LETAARSATGTGAKYAMIEMLPAKIEMNHAKGWADG